MVDAGISTQAAIGGFELATGSKPRMLGVSFYGDRDGAGSLFIDKDGTVTANGTDYAATVAYGAGSITLGAASAGIVAGSWIIGDGSANDDALDIFMAHGTFAARPGAAYVQAGTSAVPGLLNVTSINGGTVSFLLSCPHEDTDDLADGDGYFINLWAYARGGI